DRADDVRHALTRASIPQSKLRWRGYRAGHSASRCSRHRPKTRDRAQLRSHELRTKVSGHGPAWMKIAQAHPIRLLGLPPVAADHGAAHVEPEIAEPANRAPADDQPDLQPSGLP